MHRWNREAVAQGIGNGTNFGATTKGITACVNCPSGSRVGCSQIMSLDATVAGQTDCSPPASKSRSFPNFRWTSYLTRTTRLPPLSYSWIVSCVEEHRMTRAQEVSTQQHAVLAVLRQSRSDWGHFCHNSCWNNDYREMSLRQAKLGKGGKDVTDTP